MQYTTITVSNLRFLNTNGESTWVSNVTSYLTKFTGESIAKNNIKQQH